MIRIIVDRSSEYAEEFAAWLNTQDNIEAWVEPAGRHTAGKHQVSTSGEDDFDGDEEDLLGGLWESFCNSC